MEVPGVKEGVTASLKVGGEEREKKQQRKITQSRFL